MPNSTHSNQDNTATLALLETSLWVEKVIVKYNFCPFARKELQHKSLSYTANNCTELEAALIAFVSECQYLLSCSQLNSGLLIFTEQFKDFEQFLDLVELANISLQTEGLEGVIQVAHFHPEYQFADCQFNDPENYTNRAPWPTLHLIKESVMDLALASHPDPEQIPEDNIKLCQRKGTQFWQQLLSQIKP